MAALQTPQQDVDTPMDDRPSSERPCCWICLEQGLPGQPLQTPCNCSARPVHIKCLAREENVCRFCNCALPDWRSSLTPPQVKPVRPVMAIKFDGKTYKLRVQPGPEGLQLFKEQVRQLLGFDINEEFDVSFECQVPSTGEKLSLTGLSSYGAATHCAAVVAAERKATATPTSTPPPGEAARGLCTPTTRPTTCSSPSTSDPRAASTSHPNTPTRSIMSQDHPSSTSTSTSTSTSSSNPRHGASRLATTFSPLTTTSDQPSRASGILRSAASSPTPPIANSTPRLQPVLTEPPVSSVHTRSRSVTMDHAPVTPPPSRSAHLSRPRRSSDTGTPQGSLARALSHSDAVHQNSALPPITPKSPGSVASSSGFSCVNLSSTSSTSSSVTSGSPTASSTVKLPLFSKASVLARQTLRRLLGVN